MAKKVIISEQAFRQIMLQEALSKKDIADVTKSSDFEDKVRDIVASSIEKLCRTMWQRTNIWKDAVKK